MNRSLKLSLICVIGVLLGGCGSAPVRFHTLLPSPAPLPAARSADVAFAMDRVIVPPQVDVANLLLGPDAQGTLVLLEDQQWASPLADEIRAAVSQQLQFLLGLPDVSRLPVAPNLRVHRLRLDLQRFEVSRAGDLHVAAQWTLSSGQPAVVVANCRTQVSEAGVADSSAARVDGYRRALAILSRDIAGAFRALAESPAKAACIDSEVRVKPAATGE